MKTQMVQTVKTGGLFFYLLFLTGFFFLVEISFFIQCNKAYLSDFHWVTNSLHIPVTIIPGVLYFIGAQLLVHFVYCLLIVFITSQIAQFIKLASNKQVYLGTYLWCIGIVTILVANQYYFPNSKFSGLSSLIFFHPVLTKITFVVLSLIFSGLVLLSIIFFLMRSAGKARIFYLMTGVVLSCAPFYFKVKAPLTSPATAEHPNIILIGVDSLRPDFLSYFGHDKTTPFFDKFLQQSVVFSESITPLARTFPSWSTILTGLHPRENGVRSNLAPHHSPLITKTLPGILRQHGYQTILATDETRFSNLDENYGFERLVTPPIGLNDFLLGSFNDFPLSNLLVNTSLGKWLFPHSYANRPVYFTYNPDSFLTLVQPILEEQQTKPLFLTIHFCLTHYPYMWSGLSAGPLSIIERYDQSVSRVDKQLNKFFGMLQANHLLDHAIVVLLSDHGEALELPGDRITEKDLFISAKKSVIPRFYPPSLDDEAINQSAGHGTDVLGLPQYHTLLAFRLFGVGQQQQRIIPGIVSMSNIKPTILELIHLSEIEPQPPKILSHSLVSLINGSQISINWNEHLFLESDYTPEAIRTVYPETRKVLLEGVQLFQVNPTTTRLTLKEAMYAKIIHSKQYADIYQDWMLALYPQNKNLRMPILINLKSGQWTNDLQSDFARRSPASIMLRELKTFYGDDLK